MRKVFYLFLFFGMLNELKAQGTVTFKENIFNNNRFKIDGIDADAKAVAKLMTSFESSQKNFLEGHKQMRIGSGLKILGIGVMLGAYVNYGLSGFTPDGVRTFFLISTAGAGVGIIGLVIRNKGKSRVETAVAEYNYLKDRGNYNEVGLRASPGKIGLVFNF
jgi:hypothetical protein